MLLSVRAGYGLLAEIVDLKGDINTFKTRYFTSYTSTYVEVDALYKRGEVALWV